MNRITTLSTLLILTLFWNCKKSSETAIDSELAQEVQTYLDTYTAEFLELRNASSEAQWQAQIKIIPGDSTNAQNVQRASEAFAQFTGSKENIEKAKSYLQKKSELPSVQVRQLEKILYAAANNPEIVSELVKKRIKAENAENEKLYGYSFLVDNKEVTTGQIDSVLRSSSDLNERLRYWEASKAVGIPLKDGLENLRDLRNQTVQALDFTDYFSYQVSSYGMDNKEMMQTLRKLNQEIWPLYRELHTWARYSLAEKYQTEVPEQIPAHWLPNRWSQDWLPLVDVAGLDVDAALADKSAEWVVRQGEAFYTSIGFEALPGSFYEKSSMYPLPDGANYKKNNHASAWHMDLEKDVRCLMSVEPNADYYETVHHELGHIYYYLAYTNPEVPPLLRGGANRAFHEGVGSLLGLAALQKPFLAGRGLADPNAEVDQMQLLLKEALNYVVFMPWSAGVMSEFEYELYANNLPKDQFNSKWWELKKKYQGVVAPSPRGENFNDAASKTHIINDAAQYYDYALSYVLLFQIHDHIAKNILKQDVHATNYFGEKPVGDFLHDLLSVGANCDWRDLMQEKIGGEISAKPMLDYFEPLMAYLKKQNEGRTHSLPEQIM